MSVAPPVIFASAIAGGPSLIRNLGVDRGNIAKLRTNHIDADTIETETLIVNTAIDIPDGSLQILSAGAGDTLVQQPGGGILTNESFTLKTLTAGTDISLSSDANTITINAAGASAVTLVSAGGTQTLVNDGIGPLLKIAGLSAGPGISLTPVGAPPTAVTINNVSTFSSAGGTSIIVDGVGPDFQLKGVCNSSFLRDASTATEILLDNICVRVRDANGTLPPNANPATATGDGTIAIGANASSIGLDALSIGASASAGGAGAVVVGGNCSTTTANSVVVGSNIAATGLSTVSIGAGHGAIGDQSIHIGRNGSAAAQNAIVIGDTSSANASSDNSVAIGSAVNIQGSDTISIGTANTINSDNSVAIGSVLSPTDAHKIAIGQFIAAPATFTTQFLIGTGDSGATPLVSQESNVFMTGVRFNPTQQSSFCAFTPTVAYMMGAEWSQHRFFLAAAGAVAPAAGDLPGAIHSLTHGSNNTFTIPPAADFNNLCRSWGLVAGLNQPAANRGFTLFIANRSGGVVNLVLSAGISIQDNDGSTANTHMSDGNVHMFFMCADGASGYTLRHVGALNPASLT